MNLIEALKLVDEGKKVRCKNWPIDHYIYKNQKGEIMYHCNEVSDECYMPISLNLDKSIWEIYEKPILDLEEKAYLEAVLKPFKDRVQYIKKHIGMCNGDYEQLDLVLASITPSATTSTITLPCFLKNTMYKGMKIDKEYTLEELGLFD